MFLKRRCIGLDIGSWAVKAVVLEGTAMKPILRTWGYAKLPAGVIENGEWRHPDDILKGLAGLWWRHRLGREMVVAGLEGPQIQIRRIRLEKMAVSRLGTRIRDEVRFYFPYDPETSALDFQVIDTGETWLDCLVVAVPRALVNRQTGLLAEFGIRADALEVTAIALFNLWELNYPDDRDSLVVHIGSTVTRLVYIKNRALLSVRTLVWGTRDCTAKLQKQLGMDYLSTEKGLRGDRESEEVTSVVLDCAQELFDRIEADRKYLPEGYSYSACYLAGGGSLIGPLVTYLEPRLNCTRFEPFRNIHLPGSFTDDPTASVAPLFTVAAGLALRGLHA